jgi:peroxiredoxin
VRHPFVRFASMFLLSVMSLSVAHAAPLTAGHPVPPFVLKQIDGKPLGLASYKGKVVLINFWATWCAPCRVEMPWFEEFSKKYRDRGLAVIGISLDEGGWEIVQPVLAKLKVSYPIVLGDSKVSKSYGMGDLLPATFLIDRSGEIREVKEGFGDKKEFESTIEKLLQNR